MNDRHIVSSFDRDLDGVQIELVKMGGLVEEALRNAARALATGDTALAHTVRKSDRVIDDLEIKIKTDVARVLALRAPTAGDLRLVLAVMDISSHLERCGDYAKNIAKRTVATADAPNLGDSTNALRRMSDFVEGMVQDALNAFLKRDVKRAEAVIEKDVEADQIYTTLFRSLLTHMMEDPHHITAGMQLHFIAKNIERGGDHATAIAEQTIYLVTGTLPEDDRDKGDSTSLGLAETAS